MEALKTKPVEDNISKVNNEVSVGEDMNFQRRWWRFEKIIWSLFLLIVIADLTGLLGRGPLAKAEAHSPRGAFSLKYERIERMSAPSMLTVLFSPSAVHEGKVDLWVSDSLTKPLGNQRVIPQPSTSVLSNNGILYSFPVSGQPSTIEFALQPTSPGIFPLRVATPDGDAVDVKIYALP